jgi:hypothetical protein
MIQLILGKKGSGKSKQIVQQANELVKDAKGDIVFIDDDNRYVYDLKHEIRFVNSSEYYVDDVNMFYGFICGMLSQDFDISHIFIDGIKNMVHKDLIEMEGLFKNLNRILKKNNVKAVIVVSADPKTIPEYIKKYISE